MLGRIAMLLPVVLCLIGVSMVSYAYAEHPTSWLAALLVLTGGLFVLTIIIWIMGKLKD